jgi:hypothetical protein
MDRRRHSHQFRWLLAGVAVFFALVDSIVFAARFGDDPPPISSTSEVVSLVVAAAIAYIVANSVLARTAVQAALGCRPVAALRWAMAIVVMTLRPDMDQAAVAPQRAREGDRRLDHAMLRLLGITADVTQLGTSSVQANRHTILQLVALLEEAGHDAERFAAWRTPLLDRAARHGARLDGVRLGSVIRSYKAPLARAVGAAEYQAIAQSMTKLLTAWACDDFDTMVGGAPEVTKTWSWRSAIPRLANTLVLAVAGLVLPSLPLYRQDPSAATTTRYTLLIAAAVALTTNTVSTWGAVSGALNTTPRK